LGRDLADDVDALGLEPFEMGQFFGSHSGLIVGPAYYSCAVQTQAPVELG
jgi:hypothetical protein